MWGIKLFELEFIHPTLRKILAEKTMVFGPGIVTSLYRINDIGSGVHETLPLRAIDESCPWKQLGNIIEKWVNDRWEYDAKRPNMKVCVYHNTGTGWHLHYQVHPYTARINAKTKENNEEA